MARKDLLHSPTQAGRAPELGLRAALVWFPHCVQSVPDPGYGRGRGRAGGGVAWGVAWRGVVQQGCVRGCRFAGRLTGVNRHVRQP